MHAWRRPRQHYCADTPLTGSVEPARGTQPSHLTQTTPILDETVDVIDGCARFSDVNPWFAMPPRTDSVRAATMVGECDVVLVIGLCTPSNSRRLVELAQLKWDAGLRIDGLDDY